MSALTDYENVNNQNILSGINRAEQCFGRPPSATSFPDSSLPCTSYGSNQYNTVFDDSSYVSEDKYCTVPSLYSPVTSINNNSRTEQVPSSSSVYEEELEDEDGGCILSELPKSCQDFEVKEMHIRLERNQSSPLVTGHVSPCHSSRVSSNCPSVEPPVDLAEPEDLEVQWINESFEEQQKQSKMYQSGDLKSLFYNGSDQESSKGNTRSNTEKSVCSPLERPDRLPYAKKLLPHDADNVLAPDSRPLTPPHTLQADKSFAPLLTPKSEALIQKQMAKKGLVPSQRRVSEPLARKPGLFWNTESLSDLSVCDGGVSDVFDTSDDTTSAEYSLANRHVSFAHNTEVYETARSASQISLPIGTCDSDTEQLAIGIVESLFEGVGHTPVKSNETMEDPFSSIPVDGNRDVNPIQQTPEPEPLPEMEANVLLSPEAAEEPGDSWEDMDDDVLTKQLEAAKLEVAEKVVARKVIDYYKRPDERTPWDNSVMPHVLEAYNIPDYKLCDDVEGALASLGYGSTVVKWIERKIVLVAFDGEREARDAMVLHEHAWLKLRTLAKSGSATQKAALELEKSLRPLRRRPRTHAGVARRMVEGALGKKSVVSKEHRQAENKQLSDAKAAKKSMRSTWDD